MHRAPRKFAETLACIEALPIEDQTAFVEIVNKRIVAVGRQKMLHEIAEARTDYAKGNVERGSAAALMRQLRPK